jgi:hypothetical protein
MTTPGQPYPRALTDFEGGLIDRVLPAGAPGYAPHREFIAGALVIGQGRRGEGEIILGERGDTPDIESPLPAVFAYGVARSGSEEIFVTVREIRDGQLPVEIVGRLTDRVDPRSPIDSFWTYSDWRPGMPCRQCGGPVREAVVSRDDAGRPVQVLGICRADRRLWIFDGTPMTCRPIPVTNYYNELMLLKQIRDPGIALVSGKLFERLDGYDDGDLAGAFLAYNRIRTKISTGESTIAGPVSGRGFGATLKKIFLGG